MVKQRERCDVLAGGSVQEGEKCLWEAGVESSSNERFT